MATRPFPASIRPHTDSWSNVNPYTDEELEADFRAALDDGEPGRIRALAQMVDQRDQAAETVPLVAAALWYAEQDLGVFPLRPRSKIPFPRSRGCKDATTDVEKIAAWWTKEPEANIGLATGGLVDVIDVDGPRGVKSFADHVDQVRAISLGMVSTPRPGGQHWYIRHVEGRGNKAGILDGVDTRGAGGYVVAPPSRTDIGSYRWIHPLQMGGNK